MSLYRRRTKDNLIEALIENAIEAIEQSFENVRETNIDMRDAAEVQIEEKINERSEIIGELDLLENSFTTLEGELRSKIEELEAEVKALSKEDVETLN